MAVEVHVKFPPEELNYKLGVPERRAVVLYPGNLSLGTKLQVTILRLLINGEELTQNIRNTKSAFFLNFFGQGSLLISISSGDDPHPNISIIIRHVEQEKVKQRLFYRDGLC